MHISQWIGLRLVMLEPPKNVFGEAVELIAPRMPRASRPLLERLRAEGFDDPWIEPSWSPLFNGRLPTPGTERETIFPLKLHYRTAHAPSPELFERVARIAAESLRQPVSTLSHFAKTWHSDGRGALYTLSSGTSELSASLSAIDPPRTAEANGPSRNVRIVLQYGDGLGGRKGPLPSKAVQALCTSLASPAAHRLFSSGLLLEGVAPAGMAADAVATRALAGSVPSGATILVLDAPVQRASGVQPTADDLERVRSALRTELGRHLDVIIENTHRHLPETAFRAAGARILDDRLAAHAIAAIEAAQSGRPLPAKAADIRGAASTLQEAGRACRQFAGYLRDENGPLAKRARAASAWILVDKKLEDLERLSQPKLRQVLVRSAELLDEMSDDIRRVAPIEARQVRALAERCRAAAQPLSPQRAPNEVSAER